MKRRTSKYFRLSGRDRFLFLLALVLLLSLAGVTISTGIRAGDTSQQATVFLVSAILAVALFLVITWGVGKRFPTGLGLLVLGVLALFNALELASLPVLPEPPPGWRLSLSLGVYTVLPALVVAAVTMLAATGLKLLPVNATSAPLSPRARLWRLVLSALVAAVYLYTFGWMWLWDGTNDGLRGLAVLDVSGLAALAAALVLALSSTGWRRWAGVAFPVLLLGAMYVTAANAWQGFDNPTHAVTERRAERIREALDDYQGRTGRYPAELTELAPQELWRISRPVILPDGEWCYEGEADYYRLGAIYREHWSAPSIAVRVYASAGTPPEAAWICEEKLAELQPKYDMSAAAPAPSAVPLPTSTAPGGRITVEPAVRALSTAVGSWSPDGAYLVFGLTEFVEAQVEIELSFLSAETGQVCRAGEPHWTADERSNGLTDHFAWLPDGRLLYVSEGGEMVAMTPCEADAQALASRYPETFTHIVAFDGERGQVLLKSEGALWLMDGASLEARPIPGITPSPTGEPRGSFAWSPDGRRLAVALPDGDGIHSLFIVDGSSGEVERQVPLPDLVPAEEQVWVEWLTGQELLVQGTGLLSVLDLSADRAQMIDLLREVFLLDAAYPTDFWSIDFTANPAGEGYYLGVQLNHPRNQSLLVYDSHSGQVEVFDHDTHTMLFVADGGWMLLSKSMAEQGDGDEYVMVWVDQPAESRRLVVEGHTPRSHPQIFPRYLPASKQLVVSSSQGVSLISLPDGETVAFWDLVGAGAHPSRPLPAPGGETMVVEASGAGLYYISLLAND